MYMKDLKIPNLQLVERIVRSDKREFFTRLFCVKELSKVLCGRKIVQIKHSCVLSNGAILGLNYQPLPFSKIKPQKCGKGIGL